MKAGAPGSFGAQLKALREAAGFTQEELATIAGLSVHAVSALERGERRRPHVETVRALSAALDLTGPTLTRSWRARGRRLTPTAVDELSGGSLPVPPTALLGREPTCRRCGSGSLIPPHASSRSSDRRSREDPSGAGARPRDRGRGRDPRRVRLIGRHPGFRHSWPRRSPRHSGWRTSARRFGRTRACRVRRSDHAARARQLRARLDAASLVADLLTSVASLRLLVTSRAPLRVRGEREYAVGPLALEAEVQRRCRPPISRALPAVHLFVERVRDVQPDFRLTPANGSTVAAICRRLDALPLALELAAPWIKVLTPEDLLRRLAQDVLLAAPGPRDLPERQQTMNATVAWSYRLLDPEEQRAFRRFGALPGLFPIDAAAEVLAGRDGASAASDEALRAVARLIDKSLLLRAEFSWWRRVRCTRCSKPCGRTRPSSSRPRVSATARWRGWCAIARGEASLAAEGLVGPAQVEWLDRVREDLESYRVALTWLIERGRAAEASDIAWALMFFWLIRGHAAEGLRWYEQTLNLPSLPPAAESRALLGAAVMRYTQGEHKRARTGADAGTGARPRRRRYGDGRASSASVRLRRIRPRQRERGPRLVYPQR